MLTRVARQVLPQSQRVIAGAVRLGGQVGRAAAPVAQRAGAVAAPLARRVGAAAEPVVRGAGTAVAPVAQRAGAVAAPLTRRVGAVAAPVVRAARGLGGGPATDPRPEHREPHVAHMPAAPGAPTPAEAHASAVAVLAEAGVDGHGTDAADLPVDDWNGLTPAAVRQRIRPLGEADLVRLLAYERAHAHRPAIVLALENRLARV